MRRIVLLALISITAFPVAAARPAYPFRGGFVYQNSMYLMACWNKKWLGEGIASFQLNPITEES